jgi:hypothetical protein
MERNLVDLSNKITQKMILMLTKHNVIIMKIMAGLIYILYWQGIVL